MYKVQYKLQTKNLSLPPPISQSTPALITAISPKSSSNLYTYQGEAVDETLRKVVQTSNQTLLMTTGGKSNGNIGSNNDPYDKILDRQPASTLNTNDKQGLSIPPQKDSYHADPIHLIGINLIINFKGTKQVIMGIDALHIPLTI